MSLTKRYEKALDIKSIHSFRPDLPMIAIMGKSNVGKSSLLNALLGEGLARKGKTPGLTTLVQLFKFSQIKKKSGIKVDYLFADLPGYGFATGGEQKIVRLRELIKTFLSVQAEHLSMLLYLFDIRRVLDVAEKIKKTTQKKKPISSTDESSLLPFTDLDMEWLTLLEEANIPTLFILTKSDKVSKSKIMEARKVVAQVLEIDGEDIFPVSVKDKKSVLELRQFIFSHLEE